MNQSVISLEQQQDLIKSNMELFTRKLDRSDEEIEFLLKESQP